MTLHIYGVVRADHPVRRELRGVGTPGGPVSLVRSEPLAVAVSPVADDTELTGDDAVRHLDVLIELLRRGPVLPIRFGTVSPDAAAVATEILDPAADDLAAGLDSLDGLVELRLVVSADEDAEIAAVVCDLPEAYRRAARETPMALDDRIALGEHIHAGVDERRRQRGAMISRRLAPRCRGVRELSSEDLTTSKIAILVPADEVERLDPAIQDVFTALGPGYESEYIGPLPAVDFVDISQPSEREQPPARWGWTETPGTTGEWGW